MPNNISDEITKVYSKFDNFRFCSAYGTGVDQFSFIQCRGRISTGGNFGFIGKGGLERVNSIIKAFAPFLVAFSYDFRLYLISP